jgi:twitching motility protein PilT
VTPSGLRTRANLYRSHGGTDATFRLLPRGPQSLEELNLPGTLAKLVSYHQGLVLVTGPDGSGKSATLAALVNLLNEERPDHILLLEDPIEIIHPAKKALVNQRQVRRDTESFARALRGALREDPDVIVIGDLRDRETISLAITAAETGHLVIGSMNTNNASRTVGRLIDAFPPVQQGQVRAMLSESLRGVVSQKLVLGKAGRRLPAIELLFNTAAIGNVIRKGELVQLRSQMQVGKSLGMRTFDESLKDLVAADKLDGDEARKHAESPSSIPNSGAPSPLVAGTPQPAVPPPGAAAPRGPMGMPPKPAAPAASAVRPNPLVPRPGSRS